MADTLIVLSDTKNVTGQSVVIEDYTKKFVLCRSGVWVGLEVTFTETVTLSYEHQEEPLYVGWAVNGVTVVDPGYSSGTPPWGAPCPGAASVTYRCPVDGLFHRISFTSTSGDPHECLWVQVLYRGPNDAGNPPRYGPAMWVCLAGSEIDWPLWKLLEWEACLASFWERLRRYVEVAHVNPGDPVEWLATLPGEEAVRLHAEVQALEKLDVQAQPELAKALRADAAGMLRARIAIAGKREGKQWRKRR